MINERVKKYIYFALFALWGGYVIVSFFKLSEFLFIPELVQSLFLSLGIFLSPAQLLKAFSGFVALSFLLAGAYFTGSLLTRDIGQEDGFTGNFLVASGIGLVVFSLLVFILGTTVGLIKPVLLFVFWGIGTAGIIKIWFSRHKIGSFYTILKEKSYFTWCYLALAVVAFLLNLIAVLSPENQIDTLVYHLTLPAQYLKVGRITDIPWNIFSYFTQNTEMLYTLCLASAGDLSARLLHFFFGAGCSVLLYLIGKRLFSRPTGILAACLFWLIPQVGMETWSALNDLSAAFYVLLNLYLLTLIPLLTGRKRTLAVCLSALAAGFALGIKYVTIPAVIVSLLYLYSNRVQETGKKIFSREVILFLVILLLPVLFWQIRNLLLKGAPFYPFFIGKVPGFKLAEYYGDCGHSLHFAGLYDFFLNPWFLVQDEGSLNSFIGPVFLFAMPLFLFTIICRKEIRKIAFYSLVFFVTWRVASDNWRFFLPGIGYLCLLIPAIIDEGPFDKLNRALLKTIMLILLIGNVGVLYQGFNLKGAIPVVTGRQTASEYLSQKHIFYQNPYYPAIEYINDHLPPSSLVLFYGETRGYYGKQDFIASTAFDEPVFQQYYKKASNGEELAKLLKASGITHILFNNAELSRLQSYYKTYDFSDKDLRVLSEFWELYSKQLFLFKGVSVYQII